MLYDLCISEDIPPNVHMEINPNYAHGRPHVRAHQTYMAVMALSASPGAHVPSHSINGQEQGLWLGPAKQIYPHRITLQTNHPAVV